MCQDMTPLELAIQFHGHICPGLLMGTRAAEFAQKQLCVSKDQNEGLLAIVETNSCEVDAIQAILGCTFGKGNLIFKDYGKNVYTIASRDKKRAVRIVQKFTPQPDPDFLRFKQLDHKDNLIDVEALEKEKLVGVIFEKIMSMPFEEIFNWEEVSIDFPTKAVICPTVQCTVCGEGVVEPRAIKTAQGYICPCCTMPETTANHNLELWMEPDTDHGHFHQGEEVRVKIFKGYNMRPDEAAYNDVKAYVINEGSSQPVEIHDHHVIPEIRLSQKADGLVQVYAYEKGEQELYATVMVQIGHHHHHGMEPAGLPLEIIPSDHSHARLGENFEVKVLKAGQPLAGVEVKVTYSSTQNKEYPHRLITDAEGRARLFLTSRGNYLFSVNDGNIVSTFTLIKGR